MSEIGTSDIHDLRRFVSDTTKSIETRALAASLLGQIRDRESVRSLLSLGVIENDDALAWECLAAIGLVGSRKATRPLMRLIRETRSPLKRQAAVFALGLLADQRARTLLEKTMLDPTEPSRTRGFAAEGLGVLRPNPRTVKRLQALLHDDDPHVQRSASCALAALAFPACADQETNHFDGPYTGE
jgi:HEAT repeat protein